MSSKIDCQDTESVEIDVLDCVASSLTADIIGVDRKEQILERINKRNKDRLNYLDVKLEQRNKENLQFEGIDYFSQTFTLRANEIEGHIKTILTESATNKASSNAASTRPAKVNDLTRLFADITVEIQELQRYLTTSTMFLADFKIKACQNILNELSNSCEAARLQLLPKKKFGFSNKKVVVKTVNDNTLNLNFYKSEDKNSSTVTANTTWTLSNRNDEHICLRDDDVNSKDITISNLKNCLVELQGYAGSVQISHTSNCIFLCGPIARSLFMEYCEGDTLAVACQQLRLHSSTACRIYLHVTCRAIIEDAKEIEISTYNYDYAGIDEHFRLAGLDKSQNNYTDVADFNWLSTDIHSPNWKVLENVATPDWHEVRLKFNEKILQNKNL